jgi:hypothetical protein
MIFIYLVLLSVFISLIVFGFSHLWYSKFLFRSSIEEVLKSKTSIRKNLLVEFLSSLLLALGTVIIFAPFNTYFGFINSLLICFGIVLPFAISIANWSEDNFKLVVIKTLHRVLQINIAFILSGLLNQLMMPYIANMM